MIIKTKAATKLAKRFWPKVLATKNPKKCWEWKASKNQRGYGQLNSGGRGRPLKAHRVSWMIHNGAIPKGLNVLHSCDNPGCVRPGHLRLGTQKDNSKDAIDRRRVARGKRLPQTVLTIRQVIGIRRSYTKLIRKTSKKFKISQSLVTSILRRTRRASVK